MNITNPYSNHPQLSPLEQDVLWEYAKLGQHIRRLSELCRTTAITPNEALLLELRELEKKMGLVLTLFKGAVWAVFMDSKTQDTNISDTGTL